MRIGVTSQNFRTITGHAGRARRFLVFETGPDGRLTETERHDLPVEMSLHEHPAGAAHPVDGLDVLITGSCGQGLAQKLAARGVRVVLTAETDPGTAAAIVASGGVPAPPLPEHDHGHDHGDGHDHASGGCGCSCGGHAH